MPFTVEQIEAILLDTAANLPNNFAAQYGSVLNHNRSLAIDYLTGQTKTLTGLQQEKAFTFYALPQLLGPLDPLSPDDQLILDVLLDPAVFGNAYIYLLMALAQRCIQANTPATFQTVTGILAQKGMPSSVLFDWLLGMMTQMSSEEWTKIPDGSPLKQFLVTHMPATVDGFKSQQYYGSLYAQHHRFNQTAFFLLEEQRPHQLFDYVKQFLADSGSEIHTFLTSYKEGKYLSLMEQILEEPAASTAELQRKVATAARLLHAGKEKNRTHILRAAEDYLAHIKVFVPRWEHGIQIEELRELCHSYYIPFTSVSWFLILQYDIPRGLSLATEWYQTGDTLNEESLTIFYAYAGRQSLPILLSAVSVEAGDMNTKKKAVALLTEHFEQKDYTPLFWQLLGHRSKPVRDLVVRRLAEKDPEAETKAITLLQHKKAEMRQSAALILSITGSPAAKAAIVDTLNKETNDNARDILLETIADTLPERTDRTWVDKLIDNAAARGKLNKPLSFIENETALPELYYRDGEKLDARAVRFLLYRMSRSKGFNSDVEARYLLHLIDKTRSALFANALLKIFLDRDGRPEEKYLLFTAALLGNEDTAASIRVLVDKWIETSRFKMAEHAVGALAIQGSDKALRWVEWFSRKYAIKKANVGAAATAALEAAALELGITIYELGDRIIPDLGFDGLFRHFEAGGEEYRAFIDSRFKLAFFNDANKKLKALPSSASEELKQEFKSITKEVKDIVKSQSPRLEYYLVIQRKWDYPQWQKFFLGNPVMFIYATRLLWGVYKDNDGAPVLTFLCDEDTTLFDQAGEELTPDPDWSIGIVHPTQLDAGTLRDWQQQFFDRSIEPVFPQLDRRQASLEGIDLSRSIIYTFENKKMKVGSIRSTLDRLGWRSGPTGDGGMIGTYHLLHDEKKIEAVLEIEGVGAGFGWTGDERTGRLYFAKKDTGKRIGWYSPRNDADEQLVPLNKVPTLFLHETLAAIEAIRPEEGSDGDSRTN
jgi:hypothetical protein